MKQISELENLVGDYQNEPNKLERFETPLSDTTSFMKKISKKNKLSLKIPEIKMFQEKYPDATRF